MACSCKGYPYKNRSILVIQILYSGLLRIPCSDGVHITVVDNSYSQYCSTGLMASRDNIVLSIELDTRGSENENSDFTLEGRDPVDNYTITVCSVNFKDHCSSIIRVGACLCEAEYYGYHISASFPADVHFSTFLFKVDGKLYTTIHKTEVYRLKPNISLKVHGRYVPIKTDCLAFAPWEVIVHYELCVTGLHSPTLALSYRGVNISGDAECISADVETPDANENIYMRFQDKCKRDVELSCFIRGTSDSNDAFYDDGTESAWRGVFFVSILLLGTSGLLFIICKIRQMSDTESKSPDVSLDGPSSVDPRPKSVSSSTMKKVGIGGSPKTTPTASMNLSNKSEPRFLIGSEIR